MINQPEPPSYKGIVPDGDVYKWIDIEAMVCPHCGASYEADEEHTLIYIAVDCPGCEKSSITLEPRFLVTVGEGRA